VDRYQYRAHERECIIENSDIRAHECKLRVEDSRFAFIWRIERLADGLVEPGWPADEPVPEREQCCRPSMKHRMLSAPGSRSAAHHFFDTSGLT
jgi:hypothetical protein